MVTLGCDMVSVFISNMFPYCGIPRGRGVLRNRNPLFFGSIICVRSALYGSGYSTPLLRASVMIHRHVIEVGSRSPSCLLRTWLLVVYLSTCPERITALYSAPSLRMSKYTPCLSQSIIESTCICICSYRQ